MTLPDLCIVAMKCMHHAVQWAKPVGGSLCGAPGSGERYTSFCQADATRGMPTLSLTVKSSSLLPCPESISTEGLMQTGGTGMCVMMRYSGRSATSSKMQSSAVIAENRANTRKGLRSSATYNSQSPCIADEPASAWSATVYGYANVLQESNSGTLNMLVAAVSLPV